MKRSISQESINSGRRTPDGVTQRPAFLRSLSIEPDSPGPGTFDDDPAGKSPRDRRPLWGGRRPSPKGMPPSPHGPHPRPWPYILITALVAGCVEIKIYDAFVLNHRVVLHAIDATPARRRGGVNSSPLDRARTAASSPRNDLVKNCRVHPTHWLISTQVGGLLLVAHVGVSGELSSTKAEVARLTEALEHHKEPSPALRGSAPSQSRHLVMACAVDATPLDFQRFVYSLRLEAKYEGDAALFVREDNAMNALPWLKEASVDVVAVEHTMKCPSDPKRTCVEDQAWGPVPVSLARFRWFRDYLDRHEPYDAVLWTSVTDAFFQRDPFSPPPFSELVVEKKLVFFSEHPARPLLRQVYTMNAIHECYGLGKLEEFVNDETPALTAEALLGAGSAVKSYLGLLLFHVEAFFPKSKTCATSLSADQGHHNYAAYTKLPRELFRIAAYNTGQVFVAGQTKLAKEKIKRDKEGYVLDAESKRVPVVLQYSSFDFLKDKAKAIVEAHATGAAQRWNV